MISTAVKPSLSLFCSHGFKEISLRPWPGISCISSPIRHTHARQATLHTAFTVQDRLAPHCRFSICFVDRSVTAKGVRPSTTAGLHGCRVGFSMPLEIALQPQAAGKSRAYHQHPPQTGRKKQAPWVSQLCPLKDF